MYFNPTLANINVPDGVPSWSKRSVLISSSTEQTPPRRIVMETLRWTWWRRETRISRTCWGAMRRSWTPPKKAALPGSRSCAAWRTSTAEIRRGATPLPCTWQVMKNHFRHSELSRSAHKPERLSLSNGKIKPYAHPENCGYKSDEAACKISSHPRGEAGEARRQEKRDMLN